MQSLKKVIILTNTLVNGGAEKQSIYLANALQKEYSTKLIVYYGDKFDPRLKQLVEKHMVDVQWMHGSHFIKLFSIYKLFRQEKNTMVFSYLATTNFINGIIGKIAGVKYRVGGIRNAKLTKNKFYFQRIIHNYFLTCTVFNNYQGKNKLCAAGFNKQKAFIIPNCHEILEPPRKFIPILSNPKIITIGRFVGQKDYFTAIDAISILKDKLMEINCNLYFKYTIVGYGALEDKIRSYAHIKNVGEIVEIVINPLNATDYLKDADIYLSTSLFEGLSNSILEAMEYSLPIVATNVGDNNKLVLEGENGFLAKVKDACSIAEKLQTLIKHKDLRETMGRNGYNHLTKTFSSNTFRNNYKELISHLVTNA